MDRERLICPLTLGEEYNTGFRYTVDGCYRYQWNRFYQSHTSAKQLLGRAVV